MSFGSGQSPYGGDPYGGDPSGGGRSYGKPPSYGDPYGEPSPYSGQPSAGGLPGWYDQQPPYASPGQFSPGSPYGYPAGYWGENYGSSGYPTPVYGMPGNYYMPREHPQGTTVMVLGIISLFTCFILGIIALVMGKKALAEIDTNPAAYTNRGSVKAGVICGLISLIMTALSMLLYIGYIVVIFVILGGAAAA